jgi:hypothetical protein
MRFHTAIRFVAPLMLSAALPALPRVVQAATPPRSEQQRASEPARIAGHYNLTIATKHAQQRASLIVEEGATGYTGILVTPEHESPLSDVQIIDATLHATLLTSSGRATLVLHLTDKGVVGTLRLAKLSLVLSGERANW